MTEKKYTEKRDFAKTDEPQANSKFKEQGQAIFVIQKHAATNLHYDFRLEIDGTLKSWAVPKGPSTDPSEKRMAIPTEDHPIDYAYFEGTIPEEEYGGGTVMIWDRGKIKNLKTDKNGEEISLKDSYEMGTVEVELQGKKLQGGYALFKMKSGKMQGNWLLKKIEDNEADARRNPISTEPKSVASRRSMKEIKNDNKGESK